MRFTVIQNKSGHQPPQINFDFLPPGGTIGRSVDNNLILPDEDRAISRLQMIVHIAASGECRVTNRGNVAPVLLNNIPMEQGQQVTLQHGDLLDINGYLIDVSTLTTSTVFTINKSAPPSAVEPAKVEMPPPATVSPYLSAVPSASPVASVTKLRLAPAAPSIPKEIWGSPNEESARDKGIDGPTLGLNPLNSLPDTPSLERHPVDPLSRLGKNTDWHQPHQHTTDPTMFIHAGPTWQRQHLLHNNVSSTVAQQVTKSPPAEIPLPEVSAETLTKPAPTVAGKANRQVSSRLGIDPVAYPAQEPRPTDNAPHNLLDNRLLSALLEGIGLDDIQQKPQFNEEQMRLMGRLLSLFSQGTVALLSSRSILKRGVKAEMTMILDEANNPFKLLPSGKTVLMQMFGTQMPGFMPPEQAVRDALIDLQAHQLGMIAGIRAIIGAMLQSFNPERLEEEARREGFTSRLVFSVFRKAMLWDYFSKSYHKTAGEIEDDFHALFGEAFLHAYDVEVNQYKDSQTRLEEQPQ